jgi:hypothetical protein
MSKKTHTEKIKIATLNNDQHVGVISGRSRVLFGPMSAEDEERQYITKSNRSDYGRVVDIRIPHGYHEQCKKSWESYETDRLFRYLIDRCEDFAANGFEWEVPSEKRINYLEWFKKTVFKISTQEEKEKKVWDKWAATLNKKVPNVIPGIDEVNKWIVKHLLLGSMAPLEWEWGRIMVDDVDYEVPVRMTIHNPLSIVLDRPTASFANEKMYLKLSVGSTHISEMYKEPAVSMGALATRNGKDWHEITLMGQESKPKLEGFAIKYKWSPADNTALVYGRNVSVGQGLYPTPPFTGLYEILIMRRALTAADLAILDGIINFIIDWEIGDNTKIQVSPGKEMMVNQPRAAKYDSSGAKIEKSSIEMAKEIITSDTRGTVMQLFHPYYIKMNIKMPDTSVLLSTAKYVQSTVEVYQAFGILLSPADKRMDFSGINIQNFEELLENLRLKHVKRFWEALSSEVVDRNKGKLKSVPNMIFKPLNTKTEAFKTSLLNLIKIGKISTRSLLQAYGLDDRVEIQRIAQEIASGEKALTDRQVPVSYVQSKVAPIAGEKPIIDESDIDSEQTVLTPLSQQGRPQKGSQKEK